MGSCFCKEKARQRQRSDGSDVPERHPTVCGVTTIGLNRFGSQVVEDNGDRLGPSSLSLVSD
uniref:Uncharacterized protein n=1 Tax=Heterorhabditis bacteriophora TaxID=37862 RepID=A0A1I7XNM2_HETBA